MAMTTSAYNLLKLEVVILRRWPELHSYLNGCGTPPAPQALRNRRSLIKPCFQGNEWWSKSSWLQHVSSRPRHKRPCGSELVNRCETHCVLPPDLFEKTPDHFCFGIISSVASVRKSEHTNTGDNTASDYSRSYVAGPST